MSATTFAAAKLPEVDEEYDRFETMIGVQVNGFKGPLFTTDADESALWEAYLGNIPEDKRQYYNCHCCRRFIQRFGGLATVDDAGEKQSLLWNFDTPERGFFSASVAAMNRIVAKAKVTGVFLSSDKMWGNPKTGDWTHLHGAPGKVYAKRGTLTDSQASAEKLQDYIILTQGLADYPKSALEQAVRVLKADALYRSEKTLGIAEWFLTLHESIEGAKGPKRNQLVWLAVANAPPGYCHVRSTMISTLLDDVQAGMEFSVIAKRWADKMHPLQYQRPTAAPKSQSIEAAEKLAAELGLAPSLERRFATLEDVLSKLWIPQAEPKKPAVGGVFGHLRSGGNAAKELELPAVKMTWEKFSKTVLPDAITLEIRVPSHGSFYGLVTATNAEAPAIIQWDGLTGHARNPVTHYFYSGGSSVSQWGVASGWTPVSAAFSKPCRWQEPAKFSHIEDVVFFALEGCRDSRNGGLALFPEILRSELHGCRSVIEAHSNKGTLTGKESANANGLAFTKGAAVALRVRTRGGIGAYEIDRFD